jgi:hypothetical protein
MARWHSCNVLQVGEESRHVWQFDASKDEFTLDREQIIPAGAALPDNLIGKSWRSLWQRKLNIAWLPPEKVFLRVLHLPASDFAETLAIVELQLERISPLPVTQIVWNFHVLPQLADKLQTVVVSIVARDLVEEFLGQLEGQGYLADRLELPLLDQLLATPITGDGAWIYFTGAKEATAGLAAWWYGGVLRNIGLLHLPAGERRGDVLIEQLSQMTWAGELEGWLTSPPSWFLVADDATAAGWQSIFRQWREQSLEILPPLPSAKLAALTAQRSATAKSEANLIPAEYPKRYRQQFVDRLWMRGLVAIGTTYMVGLAIYFGALTVLNYRYDQVAHEVTGLGQSYTNAINLKARAQVLKDRQELKSAALDCWKKSAELLPEDVSLEGLDLQGGKTLTLNGVAPSDKFNLVADFYEALRKVAVNGQPMFAKDKGASPGSTLSADRKSISWRFSCELARAEEK